MTRLSDWPLAGNLRTVPTAEPPPRVDPIRTLPIVVLFLHSGCNCRCLMCDIWQNRERREIAPEDVARWLPEWRELDVQRVVLSGGEPLMHSDLWRLCDPLRQAGMAITVLTTGLLLKRDAESLARYCVDVIVSLDGPRVGLGAAQFSGRRRRYRSLSPARRLDSRLRGSGRPRSRRPAAIGRRTYRAGA